MAPPDIDSDASNAHSDSDVPRDAPAPLSNPDANHRPSHGQYDTLDDLLDDLHDYATLAGFAIHKKRSKNYVKGFRATRVDIGCYKGKVQASRADSA